MTKARKKIVHATRKVKSTASAVKNINRKLTNAQLEAQIALLEEQNALLLAQYGVSSGQGAVGSDQNLLTTPNSTLSTDHCPLTTAKPDVRVPPPKLDTPVIENVTANSRETSDFIVDCLEHWWRYRKKHYQHIERLQIDLDNCSRLNQIEIWFSGLTRRVLNRGHFRSVDVLQTKILEYITFYNLSAKPMKWKYNGTTKNNPKTMKAIQTTLY